MTDEKNPEKSWFERLSALLMREPHDRNELVDVLRDAEQRALLDPESLSMIEGVLQVSEMQVRDIMIPRSQMVVIDEEQSLQEFLPTVVQSTHSRFPVIGDNRDEVIGILHAKDCLQFAYSDPKEFNLRDILRPAVHVPEAKRLDSLLKEFRLNHNHMAVVVDEYGGVSGVVTIEDVLEQIVGEIADEFDIDEDLAIKKHSESEYTIKAITTIEEFNDYFDVNFKDNDFDTVGGLILNELGHMAKRGEKIELDRFHFEVLNADKRRIHLLKCTLQETHSAA